MSRKKINRKGEIKMTEEIKNEEQVVTDELVQHVSNEGEENANNETEIIEIVANTNEAVIEPEVQEPNPEDPEVKPEELEIKPEEPVETMVDGIVEGCARLNVRKEANKTADVVRILDKGTSVMVDLEQSTEDFYKVVLIDFDGYCVKDYIKII